MEDKTAKDNKKSAILQALAKARESVSVLPKKGRNAKFGFAYAKAEDAIAIAREALGSVGLLLLPTETHVDTRVVGDKLSLTCRIEAVLSHVETTESIRLTRSIPFETRKGLMVDKVFLSAQTTALSYMIRDLLFLERREEGEESPTTTNNVQTQSEVRGSTTARPSSPPPPPQNASLRPSAGAERKPSASVRVPELSEPQQETGADAPQAAAPPPPPVLREPGPKPTILNVPITEPEPKVRQASVTPARSQEKPQRIQPATIALAKIIEEQYRNYGTKLGKGSEVSYANFLAAGCNGEVVVEGRPESPKVHLRAVQEYAGVLRNLTRECSEDFVQKVSQS